MGLVEHAKRELELLSKGDEPADAEMNATIIKVIEAFTSYGHSGGSASWAIPVINKLLQYENLSPLTDDPDDWINVGDNVYQNRRNSSVFSTDGGKTHYHLVDRDVVYVTRKAD